MKMSHKCAISALALAIAGCGGSGSTASSAARAYLGTEGPGDVWNWTIVGSSFSATNQTTGYTYSGTDSVLPVTGFLKLTVVQTTDPGVTVGSSAYAVEFPGTALLIKPVGADTKPPIVACGLGSNPTGSQVSFNYVAIGGLNFDPVTDDAFGHVTFDVSGATYTGTAKRFAIDGTALADSQVTLTASGGEMTELNGPGGATVTGAMTPSGVCVLDYGPNAGGVIGVKQPASNIDAASLASKSYRGFLINQGKTECVSCTPNGDGTLHGTGYSNPNGVETGTSDGGSGVTVTFTGQPNPGELTVSIATSGGTEQLAGAVNRVNGKYMIFACGVGQGGIPYNVILAQD